MQDVRTSFDLHLSKSLGRWRILGRNIRPELLCGVLWVLCCHASLFSAFSVLTDIFRTSKKTKCERQTLRCRKVLADDVVQVIEKSQNARDVLKVAAIAPTLLSNENPDLRKDP